MEKQEQLLIIFMNGGHADFYVHQKEGEGVREHIAPRTHITIKTQPDRAAHPVW
ncbi:MAG: hypothetical protein K2O32_00325 [Acetatifactor sp.]|nr:hypothetical protein [Acetatifactor sp.]